MRVELAGRLPTLRGNVQVSPADEGRAVLDARRLLFASPLDLAAITALAYADGEEPRVTLLLPKDPAVTSYLQRMDVLRRLPQGTEVCGPTQPEQRTDKSKVLLEVSPLSPATADELVARVGTLTGERLGRHAAAQVFKCVGELIDNALSHGQSPLGAFVSAQAYTGATSGRPGFEFAVCDTGIGVLSHLRSNPVYADIPNTLSALGCAIQPGVSGTGDRRGNGLADLLEITQEGVGRLVLRSGDGIASIAVRHGRRRDAFADSSLTIRGTWAWLRARFP
jgi:hypothetical protein